ncbi:Tetratricopeptide repeat-containing protein [Fontimonas thermophila]|uniref:Tetratricopeptide repeat-containing protein n=1 Tax=Fontimonas thermophila TaxID=1076937 RepID=A0A1I2IZ02_9GAMM|nr:tetratricopeptide repeat protein [Fontimonas thermophila]SFF46948.1 Tetratricopeptide repeat-containing protein [Fontimonas thermophila]
MRRIALFAFAALAVFSASAAELYVPGTLDDPRVRAAEYLSRDDRHFSAIVELRQIGDGIDPLRMPADYQWRLADSYLAFGMRDRAAAIYRNLAATTADPVRMGRAMLNLAEFEYERGYLAEARATLYRVREGLPQTLLEQWQDLLARVLLAEGRYGEAVEILTELNNSDRQSPYMRYNLAVALMNDGRVPQGQTVLDRIGRMVPQNLEELALRDRANLSLGWHFLQSQQGGTAKPILSRVRLEGPFSNRALLGLGWAELAPQGERIAKVQVGDEQPDASPFTTFSTLGILLRPGFVEEDIFKRAGMRAFRLRKASKDEEEALRRALVPWVELISRDPMDSAVQEAWLAIAFTLDRLGAYTQALQYYERAVNVLDNARARMTAAIASIRQGRMVETIVRREIDSEAGWEWKLLDLPDAPETYFLQNLLAEHRFQEALKNYRDVRMMARTLDAWAPRLRAIEQSQTVDTRAPMRPEELIRRARSDWRPPWSDLPIRLTLDRSLSPPVDDRTATAPAAAVLLPSLKLAPPPARFNGPAERARTAQQRIANLREQLALAGAEQAKLLQDMALAELEAQKRQIERYLVEARFALARLYDRQKKGELNNE